MKSLIEVVKIVLMIFIIMLCSAAYAADPPPLCYPNAPGQAPDPIAYPKVLEVMSFEGACKVWFCDSGHTWNRNFLCGKWSEINTASIIQLYSLLESSKAVKDAAWSNVTSSDQFAAGTPDANLAQLALAVPVPIDPPPSGLVTIDIPAYKQRAIVNGFTWKQFGTVPLGTPCYKVATDGSLIHTKVDGYYLVDLKYVTKLVKFDPLPTAAYAKCQ